MQVQENEARKSLRSATTVDDLFAWAALGKLGGLESLVQEISTTSLWRPPALHHSLNHQIALS